MKYALFISVTPVEDSVADADWIYNRFAPSSEREAGQVGNEVYAMTVIDPVVGERLVADTAKSTFDKFLTMFTDEYLS